MSLIPLLLMLQQAGHAPAPDAHRLRVAARRAEMAYERSVRSHAPIAAEDPGSHRCYEIVGRYCLFESDDEDAPIPPDPASVQAARRRAVESLRRAFSADPTDADIAGSVVRYLVEDGRSDEAVSAARAFRWAREGRVRRGAGATGTSPATDGDTALALADWLVAFALHAAGEDSAAIEAFRDALARSPPEDRRAATDVSYLLDPSERKHYRSLTKPQRRAYEERLWRMADPLLLNPANAALAEHLARYVLVRLLPNAPRVRAQQAWGKDLEELTRRFGQPAAVERQPGGSPEDPSFIERYEPTQVALVASRLSSGEATRAPYPGLPDPLDDSRSRSEFPPGTLRELRSLPHQLTRFPEPRGVVIRADGVLAVDSAHGEPDSVRVGLFLLEPDSLRLLDRTESAVELSRDTARFTLFSALPPGEFVYGLEALDTRAKVGGRARYGIAVAAIAPTRGRRDGAAPEVPQIRLSDVLVCQPFDDGPLPTRRRDPRLHARADLEVQPHDTLGLYAEILRSRRESTTYYRVAVSLDRVDEPSFVTRAAAWVGGLFGLGGSDAPPRLQWEVDPGAELRTPLAVNLDLAGVRSGLYQIRLSVLDRRTGDEVRAERVIRVSKP